jgi:hypothetical protein
MHTSQISLKNLFGDAIDEVESGGKNVMVLTPDNFLAKLAFLNIEMGTMEQQCLLRVLSKPSFHDYIILDELKIIMENLGIFEEEEEVSPLPDQQKEDIKRQQTTKVNLDVLDTDGKRMLAGLAQFLIYN